MSISPSQSPALIDVPTAGVLMGLSRPSIYRRLASLPLLNAPGRKFVIRARLEEALGRKFTDAEVEAAAAKAAASTAATRAKRTGAAIP